MKGMRSWAEIDLAKLERNLRLIRESIPEDFKYISVVKADAYGHGILPTASRLMQSGVDLFAVANIKEASEIREMGSGWPILVLGPLLEEEDHALVELDLVPSVSSVEEISRFQKLSKQTGKKIEVPFSPGRGDATQGGSTPQQLSKKFIHLTDWNSKGFSLILPNPQTKNLADCKGIDSKKS